MARYLTLADVRAALRRGAAVEQLLGTRIDNGDRVLSWIEIDVDRQGRYVVSEFHVFDDNIEGFSDIHEFEPFNPVHPYGTFQEFDEIEDALNYSATIGAAMDRFVNSGLVEDEYRDLHRST